MKLRAISTRLEATQAVLNALKAASKLTSNLIVRCSPTDIQLIADPTYRSGPLLSRCELLPENLFSTYDFKGISQEFNLIYFDVHCLSLFNILQTLQPNIKSLKLKLDNCRSGERRFVLKISVEYPSLENSRFINHDLWITIMKRKYWSAFDEQPMDPFDITMNIPNFKQLAPIVEKLASLAQFASFSGKRQPNKRAVFSICLMNENVTTKSKFNKLRLIEPAGSDSLNTSDAEYKDYKVRTDIRRLNQVFNAISHIKPATTTCDIRENYCVCFHFYNEFFNFKITLPNFIKT